MVSGLVRLQGGDVSRRFNHDEPAVGRYVSGERIARRSGDLRHERIGLEVRRALRRRSKRARDQRARGRGEQKGKYESQHQDTQ